jgi:enoyl-CoA hydratase/carnithine racemase
VRFQANFAELGFHHGFGLSVTLPQLVGPQRAAEMLYTARKVGAREAADIGLADRVASTDHPLAEATEFAREIARCAPLAVRAMKQTLRAGLAQRVAAAVDREIGEQARLWATDDCAAGLAASRDRTTAIFHGR